MGFSKGLKNEFETAVVDELSVFKPVKVYYIWYRLVICLKIILHKTQS